jgi:hypothetical protein
MDTESDDGISDQGFNRVSDYRGCKQTYTTGGHAEECQVAPGDASESGPAHEQVVLQQMLTRAVAQYGQPPSSSK